MRRRSIIPGELPIYISSRSILPDAHIVPKIGPFRAALRTSPHLLLLIQEPPATRQLSSVESNQIL
jgi:hypothetical protein